MSKLVFSNMSGIIYILWDMTKILIGLILELHRLFKEILLLINYP